MAIRCTHILYRSPQPTLTLLSQLSPEGAEEECSQKGEQPEFLYQTHVNSWGVGKVPPSLSPTFPRTTSFWLSLLKDKTVLVSELNR